MMRKIAYHSHKISIPGIFISMGVKLTKYATGVVPVPHSIPLLMKDFLLIALFGYVITYINHFIGKIIETYYPKIFNKTPLWIIMVFSTSVIIYNLFILLKVFPTRPLGSDSIAMGIICTIIAYILIKLVVKDHELDAEKERRKAAVLEEQNRIARDLHDSVSQNLFSMGLQMDNLKESLHHSTEKAQHITLQLMEILKSVQSEMRLMIYELRPTNLVGKGLFDALETLIDTYKKRYRIKIDFCFKRSEFIPSDDIQQHIYRLIQVLLNNAVKDSKASNINVFVVMDNLKISVAFQDDGIGFDLKKVKNHSFFGLSGVKERVKSIHGILTIESSDQLGTYISVDIPLKHPYDHQTKSMTSNTPYDFILWIKSLALNSLKASVPGIYIAIGIRMTQYLTGLPVPATLSLLLTDIIVIAIFGYILTYANYFLGKLADHFYPSLYRKTPLWIFMGFGISVLAFVVFSVISLTPIRHFNPEIFAIGVVGIIMSYYFIKWDAKDLEIHTEKERRNKAVSDERNRIARDLHDSVSQNLFGMGLHLDGLKLYLVLDIEKAEQLTNQLEEMLKEIQSEMRLMIYELRPSSLLGKGLCEAIANLIETYKKRYKIEIESHFVGSEHILTDELQRNIYRVVQESLNNAVKHSKANLIELTINIHHSDFTVEIKDNGVGFDPQNVNKEKCFGLIGMKERIINIHGSLHIHSGMGKGTSILIKIPI